MSNMSGRPVLSRFYVSIAFLAGVLCLSCVHSGQRASLDERATPEEQLYAAIEERQCGTAARILIGDHPELITKCGADLYRAAIEAGSFDIVGLVAFVGVPVNGEIGNRKETPLHVVSRSMGRIYIARLLIERGADPSKQDTEGNLPIHLAAKTGALDLIQLYEKQGVPLDCVNQAGNTLLHLACSAPIVNEWNGETVAYLIERMGGVDVRNGQGQTPLHVAAASNCMKADIVALLLKAGADPGAVDGSGKTPLDLASSAYDSGLLLPAMRSKEIMLLLAQHVPPTAIPVEQKGKAE